MRIQENCEGIYLELETTERLFSPSAIDTGTKAMLSFVRPKKEDSVLDLGCGCGVVGIWAAKQIGADRVVMCDLSEEAVRTAQENAKRNGVEKITTLVSDGLAELAEWEFTLILSNPPYHTDFSVAKGFIEDGFRHLAEGGRMFMVTKRLDWYRNKLTSVFGGVTVREKNGYYVFMAEKRPGFCTRTAKQPVMSKKLQRKAEKRAKGPGKRIRK